MRMNNEVLVHSTTSLTHLLIHSLLYDWTRASQVLDAQRRAAVTLRRTYSELLMHATKHPNTQQGVSGANAHRTLYCMPTNAPDVREALRASEEHGVLELVVENAQDALHACFATVRETPQHWATDEHGARTERECLRIQTDAHIV